MKKLYTVFLLISLASFIFNFYMIDWSKSLINDNSVALIGLLASGCAFLLILILRTSIKISEKEK